MTLYTQFCILNMNSNFFQLNSPNIIDIESVEPKKIVHRSDISLYYLF